MKILRSVLSVFFAVLAGFIVVVSFDAMASSMHPVAGLTPTTSPEEMRRIVTEAIATMPVHVMLVLIVGWAAAAFVASYLAGRLAATRRAEHGYVAGLLVLLATISNLISIPHPPWMWTGVVIAAAAALFGAKIVARRGTTSSAQ